MLKTLTCFSRTPAGLKWRQLIFINISIWNIYESFEHWTIEIDWIFSLLQTCRQWNRRLSNPLHAQNLCTRSADEFWKEKKELQSSSINVENPHHKSERRTRLIFMISFSRLHVWQATLSLSTKILTFIVRAFSAYTRWVKLNFRSRKMIHRKFMFIEKMCAADSRSP